MSWLTAARTWIADHRDNLVLRALARASAKYLRAYDNLHQWDVETNGERFALETVVRDTAGDLFDVGANAGQWTSMALRVAPGRRIHAFELAAPTFAKLQRAVAAHPNVLANPFGLGDRDAEVAYHYYPSSDDRSSLVDVPDGFAKQQAHGTIRSGDAYVSSAGIESIAFLKIDVEGAELSVLRGFSETFARGAIAAVQFEHGAAHAVTRHLLADFLDFFHERGFTVHRIFPHRLEPLRYDAVQHETFAGTNYLALRTTRTN